MLQGRYEVARLLGRGGMGAVYVVNDLRMQTRQWALKEMWPASDDVEEQQQAHALFEKEARHLSALTHHNLPRFTDLFSQEVLGQQRHYLVMDFIEGQTLEERVEKEGPVSPPLLVAWALQICDLLDYLHTLPDKIILRDMKPANVMLTASGEVKVIDFGIARVFQPGRAGDTVALGTPGYAPPEQYGRGQSDPRADLYGLGATMHFALTAVNPADRPFHFDPPSSLRGEVPPALDAVIIKAVQVDPNLRFASAQDMAAALQAAMGWGEASTTGASATSRSPFTVPVTTLSGLLSSRGSGSQVLSSPPPSSSVVDSPPRPSGSAAPALAPPALAAAPSSPPPAIPSTRGSEGRLQPPAPSGQWSAPPTARMVPLPPEAPSPPLSPPVLESVPNPNPPQVPAGAPWFEPATMDLGVVPAGTAARRRFRIHGEIDGKLTASDRWLRVEPHSVRGRDPHGEVIVYASSLKPGRAHETSVVLRTRQGHCMMPVTVRVNPSHLGTGTAILAVLLTFFSVVPFVGLAGTLGMFLLYAFVPRSERGALGGFVFGAVLIGTVNALLTTSVYWVVRSLFP